MVQRSSLRQRGAAEETSRRPKAKDARDTEDEAGDEEEVASEESEEEEDDDEDGTPSDEYIPEPKKAPAPRRSGKRTRNAAGDLHTSESEEDDDIIDETLVASKSRKRVKVIRVGQTGKKKLSPTESKDTSALQLDLAEDEEDSEALLALEAAEDAVRAKEAWEAVKARKAGLPNIMPAPSTSASTALSSTGNGTALGQQTLDGFFGVKDDIGPPVTCEAAWLFDRDSLFVCWVYPLLTSSVKRLTAIMNYHSRRVHPSVPASRLPPQFASAPPSKRGASHDMLAWAVLELKKGRSGLDGPNDFALQTGKDDDGEKGGADRIEKVIKECGASDVLVVVSRWYGGTLLGPDRFKHIMTVAKAALEEHMRIEAVTPLIAELRKFDARIATLRPPVSTATSPAPKALSYDASSLTEEKIENLIRARKGTLRYLEQKASKDKATQAQPQVSPAKAATLHGPSPERR